MVRALTIVLICLLLAGCGGRGTGRVSDLGGTGLPSAPAVAVDTGLAVLDSPAPGVRAVAYHYASGGEQGAAPKLWLEAGDGASSELWVAADGAGLTDLYVTLDPPADASGSCRIDWNGELDGRLLTIAVRGAGALELGLAGIRRATAEEVAACKSTEQLGELLSDRWTLSGELRLCTVHWDAASDDAQVFDVRKTASNIYAPDQVTDLTVRLVDGEYELGWPARLNADYNQDGLVGVSDLTPLGILFGLSQIESAWLLEAHARVDGNGDGLIGVSDITPLGQRFGSACYEFRVERSTGDAEGPGEEWAEVAIAPRATTTRTGEAVTSTSRTPWQRLVDAVQPGWLYYRVTGLGSGGLEGPPSAALLAPDGTAPAWPGGAGISGGFGGPESGYIYIFEFNEDAADDRSGAVDSAVQLTGGGDPDEQLLMVEYNDETSEQPVTSPFEMVRVLYKEDDYRIPKLFEGEEYFVRIKITDMAGNAAFSGWYSFLAEYGTADGWIFNLNPEDLVLWVNREGTVRFTPLNGVSLEGFPPEVRIYVKPVAWDEELNWSYRDSYEGVEPIAYQGGEVVLEHVLEPGLKVNIGVEYTAWHGADRFYGAVARYPYWWLEPLYGEAPPDEEYKLGETSRVEYLSDGTPYTIRYLGATNHLVMYTGGLPRFYPLDGVPVEAYSLSAVDYPPQRVLSTDTIVFHRTTGRFEPGSVTWWSPMIGVTGQALEPEGVFTNEFGFEDYIEQWFPEDGDTVIGLRSMVQEADGAQVLELWEARRSGEMEVRELIDPPFELGPDYSCILMALAEGALVVRILRREGFAVTECYYCTVDSERNWTVNDLFNGLPAVFDAAAWEYASVLRWWEVYTAADLTTWIRVNAQTGLELENEDQEYYRGLYTGSLLDGFESFLPVWEWTTTDGFGPDYPPDGAWGGGISDVLMPYDGWTVFHANSDYYYSIDGSGEIASVFGPEAAEGASKGNQNFYEFLTYFTRDGIHGGLANGLLSEDGQWLAVGQRGVLGVAVRNDNN